MLKQVGEKIIAADKLNFVAPNTIKRILHVIREASKHLKMDKHDKTKTLNRSFSGMEDFGNVKR